MIGRHPAALDAPPPLFSLPVVLLMIGLYGAMLASPYVSTGIEALCIVGALLGPARALQSILIATLVDYANTDVFTHGPVVGLLLRAVLIAMAIRIIPTIRFSDLRILWPVWLFSLVCAVTSAIYSAATPISMMKIITFFVAATSVLIAFRRLRPQEHRSLQRWFLSMGLCVIAISAAMLVKPGLGIAKNGGLEGVLNQSQALGIFVAPFAAWTLAGVLLMRQRTSRLEICFAIAAPAVVFLTKARTAGFAILFALGVVMLLRVIARRRAGQAGLTRPIIVASVAALVVAIAGIASGKVGALFTEYFYKGTEHQNKNLGSAFYASRGGGVLVQWHDFLQHPWTGNGFGVYADGRFPAGIVAIGGVPISAPVEKGFLPSAILEEDGVPGAIALLIMILVLGREAWKHPDLRWRALYCACLGVNFGECVLLAPGGIGMLNWLLMGLAATVVRASPTAPATASAPAPADEVARGPVGWEVRTG